jgi:ribosome-associated heat shock protein Hsp15
MSDAGDTMRLDRFLWFARLVKTRSAAQGLAETGMLRLDGRRIERSSVQVRVGSVIAFPLRGQVRVLRVEALPQRRGPAPEAAGMYQELTPGVAQSADLPQE